jgi:selenocysteine lyase/cysteine desulfurase
MRLREHRGSFADSMQTAKTIDNSRKAIVSEINNALGCYGIVVTDSTVRVSWYGHDPRDGWGDTFIVSVGGYGVFGFTDSNPTE